MNSIAVVRARLPYTDQRSLSEAWFSALHLARQHDPLARRRECVMLFPCRGEISANGRLRAARGGATGWSRSCESPPERVMRERRREAVEVCHGRQTEGGVETNPSRRRALARNRHYARANFGIDLPSGGRVQILLRREGNTLHVVAICSARHAELVRRALACADLHLRLSGERVASSVRVL